MINGILNIHKETGMTSHDVVGHVRKLLKQRRVGHAGTLDPSASGVLPICIGQATRVAEYLSGSGKAYQAEITFGIITNTYDAEGDIVCRAPVTLNRAEIEAVLPAFLGQQMQIPPRYSAIKIQGQPAYKRTRAGEEVVLEPRPITIYTLTILDWQTPRLTLTIECSKGTYIRTLAYDLGERLGCGAYLSGLVRTRSGPFTLAQSSTLEQVATSIEQNRLDSLLFPSDYALQHYPALVLDEATAARVLHGNSFSLPLLDDSNTANNDQPAPNAQIARVYDATGRFLAIVAWNAQQNAWQPEKVFATIPTL